MYSLFLLACVLVVILSPLLLDFVLNLREARYERRLRRAVQKKGPRLAWASSKSGNTI